MSDKRKFNNLYREYPDIVSPEQLCVMLGGISIKSVYKLLKQNGIAHVRVGRKYIIPKVNVIEYLAQSSK